MIYLYVSGFFLFNAIFAFRTPEMEIKQVFWFTLLWPISLIVAIVIYLFNCVNWEFDILVNSNWFGFRKPNDGWKGYAITIAKIEFLFWKKRK